MPSQCTRRHHQLVILVIRTALGIQASSTSPSMHHPATTCLLTHSNMLSIVLHRLLAIPTHRRATLSTLNIPYTPRTLLKQATTWSAHLQRAHHLLLSWRNTSHRLPLPLSRQDLSLDHSCPLSTVQPLP